MEYIESMPIDHRNELLELDYDLREISEKMAENYVKQMLEDGFFHARPYRGNLCIKDGKIVWIDWAWLFGIPALGCHWILPGAGFGSDLGLYTQKK